MTSTVTRHRTDDLLHQGRNVGSQGAAPVLSDNGVDISWERRYHRAVVVADLIVIGLAGVVSVALRSQSFSTPLDADLFSGIAAVVAGLTLSALAICRCWDRQILGQGSEEFNRIIRACVLTVVVLSIGGLALKDSSIRPWVFGVVPATAALLLGARWGMRRVLHRARRASRCMRPVLVAGTEEAVENLVDRTTRARHHGWKVIAACTPSGHAKDGGCEVAGVPVVGTLDAVPQQARVHGARIVAVASAPGLSPTGLHHLSWDLEGTTAELVVDPGLMEIAGPRLHMEPIDGLPMLRLTEPRLTGASRLTKHLMDRVTAAVCLILLLPVFLLIAALIRFDRGPVFYRQTRVGLAGRNFSMIKFRSMVVDADRVRDQLADADEGAGPLFKVKHDPRITRIGAVLRRYSIDELPQLLNVLAGSMSLVGPRPPLPDEVEEFSPAARRRLLVRPGITGLWQISGRSDLSWEASVRLDLRYVENWTPALDLLILWKTAGAVVRGRGAY
jgi:exopolysaccharide biosynthesis polyprenyl glycosylphosphotransferase